MQNALREVLPELVENDLAARIFETNAEIATAAENLLVDALDPAASVYGESDGEERASAEEVQLVLYLPVSRANEASAIAIEV